MVVDGHLTVGALASYCLYATNLSEARRILREMVHHRLTRSHIVIRACMMQAMKDATDGVAGMIKAQGSAGRLYALLESKPTTDGGGAVVPPKEAIKGRIEFRDACFAYPTRPRSPVLDRECLENV